MTAWHATEGAHAVEAGSTGFATAGAPNASHACEQVVEIMVAAGEQVFPSEAEGVGVGDFERLCFGAGVVDWPGRVSC
jgi:hypothetical protein